MAAATGQGGLTPRTLRLLLRPLVRFFLRHKYTVRDFIYYAQIVFLELAEEEIRKHSEKVNASRLSLITGLNRKQVAELRGITEPPAGGSDTNLLNKIIGRWRMTAAYTTSLGKPRTLSYEGEESEFFKLVREESRDYNPATILFELERMGSVRKTRRGLRLRAQSTQLRDFPERGFELLSEDIQSLITSVEQNLLEKRELANLHIRTSYDNVYREKLPEIQQWLLDEGRALHKRAREYISQYDHDLNPQPGRRSTSAGGRVVLGAFGHTEDVS